MKSQADALSFRYVMARGARILLATLLVFPTSAMTQDLEPTLADQVQAERATTQRQPTTQAQLNEMWRAIAKLEDQLAEPTPTAYEIELRTIKRRIDELQSELDAQAMEIERLRGVVVAQPVSEVSLREEFQERVVIPCVYQKTDGDKDSMILAIVATKSDFDESYEMVKPVLESVSRDRRVGVYAELLSACIDAE